MLNLNWQDKKRQSKTIQRQIIDTCMGNRAKDREKDDKFLRHAREKYDLHFTKRNINVIII